MKNGCPDRYVLIPSGYRRSKEDVLTWGILFPNKNFNFFHAHTYIDPDADSGTCREKKNPL